MYVHVMGYGVELVIYLYNHMALLFRVGKHKF